MEYGLVLANAAIAVLALVYIHRRSHSMASLHWAAAWTALVATGALAGLAGPPTWARMLGHATGLSFSLLFLSGSLAFVGRPVPRWLLPIGIAGAALSSLIPLGFTSATAYLLAPVFETPPVAVGAWLVWRARTGGSLPERMLGPALGSLAVLNVFDGFARAAGADGLTLALLWLGVLIVLGLIQLASLLERSLARERALEEDLGRARKLEALGRLAGGMAHELSNQLTVVVGNAALLRDDTTLDVESLETLEDLERSALRCADRARDMLAFARETGGEPRPVDLTGVVRDLRGSFVPTLPDGVVFQTHVANDAPCALADPNQLRRVLTHLLQNARDAVQDSGRIVLRIVADGRPSEAVFPLADPKACWLRLEVEDDGEGMDQETQEHVFDPFFTTRPDQGAGIGLSIVYGVVRAHGGSIEIESGPDAGTLIRVRWPADPPEAVPPRPWQPRILRRREATKPMAPARSRESV